MIPTRYINAGPMQAQASDAPAMAAGRATEQIGNALAQVGEAGMAIMGKIRRIEEQGKINAFMAQADEEAGRFSIDLAQRADTDAWPQEWKDKAATLKQQGQELGLSPESMAHLDNEFTNWSSNRSIHFETQAATKKLGIARAQTTQALEYYASREDEEGFNRTLGTASWLSPEEKEMAHMHRREISANNELDRMIEGDPQGLRDATTEELLKKMPGATVEMVERSRSAAKGAIAERGRNLVMLVEDEIASNNLKDPEQLDKDPRFKDMRPAVKEEIKTGMRARAADGYREEMATPEFQAETYGRISAGISNYNPDDDNADLHLAQIDTAMRNLKPGYLRDKLEKQFQELGANGQLAETKSYGDFVLKQVDELAKAGRFGKVPEIAKIKTADLVKDGFLKDPAKLQRLGFSKDQAGQIAAAAAEDPALGQGKLSELWTKRDAGNVKADEFEIATANALRNGHPTVNFDDPESAAAAAPAQIEAARKHGIAKMKVEEFLRLNPEASKEKIDAEYLKITGEGIRAEAKAKVIAPKPTRGGFGQGETSMVLPQGLAPIKDRFVAEGVKHGIDPRFLAAIAMHETANGTSSAYRNKNNAMGVSNSKGPIAFEETGQSIEKMARLLGSTSSGPYKNARTIAEIGKIYAPVGAENDPGGLNSHWAAGVAKYFKQLGGNPLAMIK